MDIGITGAPGSGKTTFSNKLEKFLPNSSVVSGDKLLDSAKDCISDSLIIWRYNASAFNGDFEEEEQAVQKLLDDLSLEGIKMPPRKFKSWETCHIGFI